jgi:hypothetical protein
MFLLRAFAVWLLIMCIEVVHGTLRTIFLAPLIGDFLARQLSVLTGSLLILTVAFLFVRWIRASTTGSLLIVGLLWLLLTLLFEFCFGHFILGLSWERLASDYDLRHGGLLTLGLVVLMFAPLMAAKLRDIAQPRP